jgi:(1->4)-alpha-D-glucan 1-alpha-D-glucosylmutase
VNDKPAPSPNDEYLLYQTLVGAWPFEAFNDQNGWDPFRERIEQYMLKAIREAKKSTSWINRNTAYENAVSSFVKSLLTPGVNNDFLNDFMPFQRRVARIGLWNSLSQTLLKLTCPGVPDIYQGNELWNLSLVDPDNRRPVDYIRRRAWFESIRKSGSDPDPPSVSRLLETPEDGRLKLFLIWRTLCFRKQWPDVFQQGEYVPLTIQGAKADHLVAFVRSGERTNVLVVVPRLVAGLLGDSDVPPIGPNVWGNTEILLPSRISCESYQNAFTEENTSFSKPNGKIAVSELVRHFPAALCLLGPQPLQPSS